MDLSDLINKNPYRILDIPGCSSQTQIYKASDRAEVTLVEHID